MATPGPKQGAFSRVTSLTPTVLGGPEAPPIQDPQTPRPQRWSPRDADGSWAREEEGKEATGCPWLPRPARPAHLTHCPAPTHASCPVHPSHRCSSGSKWFHHGPSPSGAGAERLTTPSAAPGSEATMLPPSRVCPPPPLPLLPAASSLSPCPPRSLFTRVQLTFLRFSPSLLSPFLPSALHKGWPWARPLRLSLCLCAPSLCLSLSCDLR